MVRLGNFIHHLPVVRTAIAMNFWWRRLACDLSHNTRSHLWRVLPAGSLNVHVVKRALPGGAAPLHGDASGTSPARLRAPVQRSNALCDWPRWDSFATLHALFNEPAGERAHRASSKVARRGTIWTVPAHVHVGSSRVWWLQRRDHTVESGSKCPSAGATWTRTRMTWRTCLRRRRNSQWPAVQGAQRPRHAKRMQVATSGTRHVRMRVETSGRIKAFLSRRKVAAGQICNVWRVLCYAF